MTIKRSSKERRIEIAQAALKIVSEHGIKGFTTAALAKEVGLAEGTIFKHFSNKQEIIDSAIIQAQTLFFANLPAEIENPLEKLGVFFKQRAQTALANPQFVKILQSGQLSHSASPQGVIRLKKMREQSINFIQSTLKDAETKGMLQEGVSLNVLTFLIYSSVSSLANLGDEFLNTSRESIDTIWDNIYTLISCKKQ
jgi:AcrR family transcriptional regulator